MIWREDNDYIYALYNNGAWGAYENIWYEGDPQYSCPDIAPSQSPPTPLRGFGKIWCTHANVRNGLGNAVAGEQGNDSTVQTFELGTVLRTGGGSTYILYKNGTWTRP
jgi:hypothetical protein